MNMIRFTPTQLGHLTDLCDATDGHAPDWRSIYRRAASLERRLQAADEGCVRPLAGQEWALSSLRAVLRRCAAALRPVRKLA
ncbi:MAG: hypothetical protein ACON4Z_15180 [Planctomycetota bacterium]